MSKISILALQGDSLHRFMWNLAQRGARWSAWPYKISRQSVPGGGNPDPNLQKFPLFGKESPHRGEPFDRSLQLLGDFIPGITVLYLRWLTSLFTELLLRNVRV